MAYGLGGWGMDAPLVGSVRAVTELVAASGWHTGPALTLGDESVARLGHGSGSEVNVRQPNGRRVRRVCPDREQDLARPSQILT